jgi:hypothetical protein
MKRHVAFVVVWLSALVGGCSSAAPQGTTGAETSASSTSGSTGAGTTAAQSTTAGASTGGASSGTTTGGGGISGSGTTGAQTSGSSTTGGASGGTTGTIDAGVTGLGAACQLAADGTDSCVAYGLACSDQTGNAGTCQLPGETQVCLATVGCASQGLQCTPGFSLGTQPVSICLYTCSQTSECPNVLTSCQSINGMPVCFLNYCAQNGTGYFQPCPSATADDGMCLPYGSAGGTIGICNGTGALTSGATCTGSRANGTTDGLCATGLTCTTYSSATGGTVSVCQDVCDSSANPTGPTCGSADLCAGFQGTGYGNCLEICGADTTVVCPTGTSCQNLSFANGLFTLCVPD